MYIWVKSASSYYSKILICDKSRQLAQIGVYLGFLLKKHEYKPLNNKEASKMIKRIYGQPDCAKRGLFIMARET